MSSEPSRVLPLSRVGGCRKPSCTHRAPINRHHRAHEALWLTSWAHRHKEPKFQEFVRRYYEFREEDIVRICMPHHAEIHSIYERIVEEDRLRTGRPLYMYSWAQMRRLSIALRDACARWLLEETPGIDPAVYEKTKRLRRTLIRKRLRREFPEARLTIGPQRKKLKNKKRKRRRK